MSVNLQSDTNESKRLDSDDQAVVNSELPQSPLTVGNEATNLAYEKQKFLVEKTNNTFQELSKTLESEQTKLLELEKRRKLLLEDMLLLKAEIEQERQTLNLKIVQSVVKNLSTLNNIDYDNKGHDHSQIVDENLKVITISTCHEEELQCVTAACNLDAKGSQECFREEPTYKNNLQ